MKSKVLPTVAATAILLGLAIVPVFAGRVPDPAITTDMVEAFDTDVYSIWFRGGELAIIAVSGDGDTDLDLFVYDENDNRIAFDARVGDDCLVHFTPKWSGPFRVEVRNLGRVANIYTIVTN